MSVMPACSVSLQFSHSRGFGQWHRETPVLCSSVMDKSEIWVQDVRFAHHCWVVIWSIQPFWHNTCNVQRYPPAPSRIGSVVQRDNFWGVSSGCRGGGRYLIKPTHPCDQLINNMDICATHTQTSTTTEQFLLDMLRKITGGLNTNGRFIFLMYNFFPMLETNSTIFYICYEACHVTEEFNAFYWSGNRVSTSLGNSGLCWTVFAWNKDTVMPAEGNGDLQTLICVLVDWPPLK